MYRQMKIRFGFSIVFGILFIISFSPPSTGTDGAKVRVIAGSPEKFMEVRHVVLKGSNFQIGKRIGEIAKSDGVQILPSENKIMNKAKREYMAKNCPLLHERMKGVADAYGLNFFDDTYDFSGLFQPQMASHRCSVTFFPAEYTENGHNILSRNYDFITGDVRGKRPQEDRSELEYEKVQNAG